MVLRLGFFLARTLSRSIISYLVRSEGRRMVGGSSEGVAGGVISVGGSVVEGFFCLRIGGRRRSIGVIFFGDDAIFGK